MKTQPARTIPTMSTPVTARQRLRVPALAGVMLVLAAAALAGNGLVLAASHEIAIVDFAYEPASLTVLTGQPVTWANGSGRNHTVTSDQGTELDGNPIGPGEAYGHVFENAGTYAYHCEIHPDRMKGTITVRAASPTPVGSGSPEPTPPSGTLPPNFSPFPSTGPTESSPPSSASPTPEPTTATTLPTGGTGNPPPLVLLLLGATAAGVISAIWLHRRRTTSTP